MKALASPPVKASVAKEHLDFDKMWNRIWDFNEWDLLSPLDKAKGGDSPRSTSWDYIFLVPSDLWLQPAEEVAPFGEHQAIVSPILVRHRVQPPPHRVFWENMLRKQFYPLQNVTVNRDLVSQICQNWQSSYPQRPSQWRACGTPNRLPPRLWTKGNLHGCKITTN